MHLLLLDVSGLHWTSMAVHTLHCCSSAAERLVRWLHQVCNSVPVE